MAKVRMLVSGGQTGVDRAALDFAIAHDLSYGGWVPRGGRAEDYSRPPGLLDKYPALREHASSNYRDRTHANIRDSAATMIVWDDTRPMGPGTGLTVQIAKRLAKPFFIIRTPAPDFSALRQWLSETESDVALNVAGSRESSRPGIYTVTFELLTTLRDVMVTPLTQRGEGS